MTWPVNNGLLQTLLVCPEDADARKVYADWLEDQSIDAISLRGNGSWVLLPPLVNGTPEKRRQLLAWAWRGWATPVADVLVDGTPPVHCDYCQQLATFRVAGYWMCQAPKCNIRLYQSWNFRSPQVLYTRRVVQEGGK